MLTFSRQVWLAATLAAAVALAAGIAIAVRLNSSEAPAPAGGPFAQNQDDGGGPGGGCTTRGCGAWDEDEEGGTGNEAGNGEGGGDGDGVCTWTGSGYLTASFADQHVTTIEIPCNHPTYGQWNASERCYYGDFPPYRAIPDPPPDKTEEDGRYYYLNCPTNVRVFNGTLVFQFNANEQWIWVDDGEIPAITPLQVAERWLASAPIDELAIELAPPPTGSGLINLPVWLGVDETENTWGPIDDSDCIGPVCVSISAFVDTVEWNMGDGTTMTCNRNQHQVWQRGTDFLAPGDNCHHYYRRSSRGQPDGKYQITATSHWAVHWESEVSDAEGDLETERESTVALQIDEIQVLTTE